MEENNNPKIEEINKEVKRLRDLFKFYCDQGYVYENEEFWHYGRKVEKLLELLDL